MAEPIPNAPRVSPLYTPAVATTHFDVGFAIFSDETADLEVWHNGEIVTGWTLSATFDAGRSEDAQVVFDPGITGTLVIVGARHPRREVGFDEGRGVPARDQNKAIDVLTSVARELFDRFGRAILAPAGETIGPLPAAADRAESVLLFDADGNPVPGPTADEIADAEANAAAAAAAAADFARKYLGVFASDIAATDSVVHDPTQPVVGAFYFNSTTNAWRVWTGTNFVSSTSPAATTDSGTFTGDGATVRFDIGHEVATAQVLWVEDGIPQRPVEDFDTDGTEVVRAEAPADGAVIFWQLVSGAGSEGPAGRAGTLHFTFDSVTADADQDAGKVWLDNGDPALATTLFLDNLEIGGGPAADWIDTWDDSTSDTKGTVILTDTADPENWVIYNVTGTVVDGTGYRKVTVEHVAGAGLFGDDDVISVAFVPTGNKGADGADGDDGADGADPGLLYTFATETADADPGDGKVRANNADLSAATELYVDELDRAGGNREATLLAFDDSTSTVKGRLLVTRASDQAQASFTLSGVTDATGYVKLAVSHESGATSLDADDAISLQFYPTGDKGEAGDVQTTGGVATGRFAAFADDTGALIQDSGFAPAEFAAADHDHDSDYLSLSGGTLTGALLGAAGTAALPGYSFDGDPNTGMYRPGADELGWSTAGTLQMRLSDTHLFLSLPLDMGSQKIESLADPTEDDDAATKGYVDAAGRVLQVAFAVSTTNDTTTETTPQNSSLSLAFTPKSATSKILIEVFAPTQVLHSGVSSTPARRMRLEIYRSTATAAVLAQGWAGCDLEASSTAEALQRGSSYLMGQESAANTDERTYVLRYNSESGSVTAGIMGSAAGPAMMKVTEIEQ